MKYKSLSIFNFQLSTLLLLFLISCKEFPNPFEGDEVLAKAGKETLHRMDVEKVFPAGVTGADSTLWIESYVDRWVRDMLKLQEAQRMFGNDEDDEELVQNYRNSLLTRRWEQYYINSTAKDSLYSEKELRDYYDLNKSQFVLDRSIVKGRMIALPTAFRQKNRVRDLLRDYAVEDRTDLKALADKNGFVLREIDRWMEYPQFLELLPTRRNESYDNLLKKEGLQEMVDGATTYWFVISEARTPGMTTPYEMVHRMVRWAVSTRRKAEIVKAREDSIYRAALIDKNAVINL
jgi:thioredoxin-related protein